MCLAEFVSSYSVDYRTTEDEECDALPSTEDNKSSSHIVLSDGFGKITKRRHHAVIRFRRYSKDTEPSDWYRAKLMLYHPWCNEQTDLLGGF